ncbi:hypothetical protein P4S72_21875 [Vibrio sp. PP-XX7]
MNDNKLNFWGHNGNFTEAQVKVPFVVFGPKFNNKTTWHLNALTSHTDLVPPNEALSRRAKSNGRLLNWRRFAWAEVDRDWIISSKYSGYAIITQKTILEVLASGDYSFMDKTNRPLKNQSINYGQIQDALKQISQFYR